MNRKLHFILWFFTVSVSISIFKLHRHIQLYSVGQNRNKKLLNSEKLKFGKNATLAIFYHALGKIIYLSTLFRVISETFVLQAKK